MANHKDLKVWQVAMDLAESILVQTRSFPSSYRRSLTDQIERSAISIPSNIAEGAARVHRGDYARFLSYASGSLAELETQVLLARRVKVCPESNELDDLMDHTGRLITNLRKSLDKAPETSVQPKAR